MGWEQQNTMEAPSVVTITEQLFSKCCMFLLAWNWCKRMAFRQCSKDYVCMYLCVYGRVKQKTNSSFRIVQHKPISQRIVYSGTWCWYVNQILCLKYKWNFWEPAWTKKKQVQTKIVVHIFRSYKNDTVLWPLFEFICKGRKKSFADESA